MKKVIVTGANGQLGKCLQNAVKFLDKTGFDFHFLDRNLLDLSNPELIESYFFTNSVDYVINCAAYTAVDKAEETGEIEKAFQINADAVKTLAKECANQNACLIHISTDYVFNGLSTEPFTEDEITSPINVYGKSKLEGERLALGFNNKTIIIRTAWVYSQYGKNFLQTMLRLFREKEELSIVNDQIGSPTNANDLAEAILEVLKTENKTYGIYHYTNLGETSWYNFAKAIKDFTKSTINLKPISTLEYPTPAKRPMYSVLNTEKIQKDYGVRIMDWKDSLSGLLNSINK